MAEAPTARRSGRIAAKAVQRSNKSTEVLAQEVLCKKLDKNLIPADKSDKARERLLKLFDSTLPDDAIEAIEDLLKMIKLDGKLGGAVKKVGKEVVAQA
jgi:flavin-dependent dehydrogenase